MAGTNSAGGVLSARACATRRSRRLRVTDGTCSVYGGGWGDCKVSVAVAHDSKSYGGGSSLGFEMGIFQ